MNDFQEQIDYESLILSNIFAWTPDLSCNNCNYETDYENFYNIDLELDNQKTIDVKIKRSFVCPNCGSKLIRYY